MSELEKAAKEIVEYAWSGDTGSCVATIPWELLWTLRDALESDDAD